MRFCFQNLNNQAEKNSQFNCVTRENIDNLHGIIEDFFNQCENCIYHS